ncbi:MAG: hypothetical protein ACRD96_20995 [Bryobacteraceae bacterium]
MDLMYWALVGSGVAITLALMVVGITVSTNLPKPTGQKAAYVLVFIALGLGGAAVWVAHATSNQIAGESRSTAMTSRQGLDAQTDTPPRARPRKPSDAARTATPDEPRLDPLKSTPATSAAPGQLRFTTQSVASTEGGPFTLHVIVLTDVTIDGPSLRIECDGPVDDARFSVAGGPPLTSVRTVRTGNSLFLSFGSPAFLPDTPVVLTLTSLTKIAVLRVTQQQF